MKLALEFYFKNGTIIRSAELGEKDVPSDLVDVLPNLFKKEIYTYHTFRFGGVIANVSELNAVKTIFADEDVEDEQ